MGVRIESDVGNVEVVTDKPPTTMQSKMSVILVW